MVGVHYFRDAAGGVGGSRSTIATIRIYVWERLVFEESAELAGTAAWWEVANIEWDSGDVDDGAAQMFNEPPPRKPAAVAVGRRRHEPFVRTCRPYRNSSCV